MKKIDFALQKHKLVFIFLVFVAGLLNQSKSVDPYAVTLRDIVSILWILKAIATAKLHAPAIRIYS